MNERAALIRPWLMRNPRPHQVRVTGRDGREHDVEPKAGTAWSEVASTVEALDPERLEAIAADGALLRAINVDDLIKREAREQQQQAATHTAMQTSDPETQRLIVFAELLERAHSRSTEAIERTVAVGFEQMREISANLAQQANAAQESANNLTVAIRNLMLEQARQAVEEANEDTTPAPSPLEAFASNFLGGQQLAQQEQQATNGAAAAPKTNGHAKPRKQPS